MQNATKKKMITFTPKIDEMIKKIQEAKGYATQAAVINQAVIEMHDRVFPAYMKRKEGEQASEEKPAADPKMHKTENIIAQLGGVVIEKTDGNKFVKYYTYTHKKRFENIVPISQITEQLLEAQYSPSKEIVERYQQEGKTNY